MTFCDISICSLLLFNWVCSICVRGVVGFVDWRLFLFFNGKYFLLHSLSRPIMNWDMVFKILSVQ